MEEICFLILFLFFIWVGAYSYTIYSFAKGYERSKAGSKSRAGSRSMEKYPSGTFRQRRSLEAFAVIIVLNIGIATTIQYSHHIDKETATAPAAISFPLVVWGPDADGLHYLDICSLDLNFSEKNITSLKVLSPQGNEFPKNIYGPYGDHIETWSRQMYSSSIDVPEIHMKYTSPVLEKMLEARQCIVRVTANGTSPPLEFLTFPTGIVDNLNFEIYSTKDSYNISVMLGVNRFFRPTVTDEKFGFNYTMHDNMHNIAALDDIQYPAIINRTHRSQNFHLFSIDKRTIDPGQCYTMDVGFSYTTGGIIYKGHINNIPFRPSDFPISGYGGGAG